MEIIPELYPALASVIKEARENAGLSQQQLADFCSIARSTVSFIECGKMGVSVTVLIQIGRAAGVDASVLLARIEKKMAEAAT